MIASIARQSVILKCERRCSALLGNYEFYYLAGLMKKLYSLQLEASMEPKELFAKLEESWDHIQPADEREEYLIKMVKVFEPGTEYDEQMQQLFQWGANEQDLWQVVTKVEE